VPLSRDNVGGITGMLIVFYDRLTGHHRTMVIQGRSS
jgi:hypothetical protein